MLLDSKLTLLLLFTVLLQTILSYTESHVNHSHIQTNRHTNVKVVKNKFYINGEPTYKGRKWISSDGQSYSIEGLLMNARLVQGIFDDLNPETRGQWTYPDTKI